MLRSSIIASPYRQLRNALPIALLCLLVGQILTAHLSFCSKYADSDTWPITAHPPVRRADFFGVTDVLSELSLSSKELPKVVQQYTTHTNNADDPPSTYNIIVFLNALEDHGAGSYRGRTYPFVVWTFYDEDDAYSVKIVCSESNIADRRIDSIVDYMSYTHNAPKRNHNLSCTEHDTFDADELRSTVLEYPNSCGSNYIGRIINERSYKIAREAFFSYILDECTHRKTLDPVKNENGQSEKRIHNFDPVHDVMIKDLRSSSAVNVADYAYLCDAYRGKAEFIMRPLIHFPVLADFRAVNLLSCDKPWTMLRSNTKEDYALIEYFLENVGSEQEKTLQPTKLVVTLTDSRYLSLKVYALELDRVYPEKPGHSLELFCDDISQGMAESYHNAIESRMKNSVGRKSDPAEDSTFSKLHEEFFDKWRKSCHAQKYALPSSSNVVDFEYVYEKFGDGNRKAMESSVKKMLSSGIKSINDKGFNVTLNDEADIPEKIIKSPSFTYFSHDELGRRRALVEFHHGAVDESGAPGSKKTDTPDQTHPDVVLVISIDTGEELLVLMATCPVIGNSKDIDEESCVVGIRPPEVVTYDNICSYGIAHVFYLYYARVESELNDLYNAKGNMSYGDRHLRDRVQFLQSLVGRLCHGYIR